MLFINKLINIYKILKIKYLRAQSACVTPSPNKPLNAFLR